MSAPAIRYTIILDKSEECDWVGCVPAFNWPADEGDTLEEAISNIREAIIGYIEALEKEGLPIPTTDLPGPHISPWQDDEIASPSHRKRIFQSFQLVPVVA